MKKLLVILILGFLSEQISIKSPISGNQTLNNLAVANNNRQFKNETHQPQELTKKGSSGSV